MNCEHHDIYYLLKVGIYSGTRKLKYIWLLGYMVFTLSFCLLKLISGGVYRLFFVFELNNRPYLFHNRKFNFPLLILKI